MQLSYYSFVSTACKLLLLSVTQEHSSPREIRIAIGLPVGSTTAPAQRTRSFAPGTETTVFLQKLQVPKM